jgi:hypothetical protein
MKEASPAKFYFAKYFFLAFGLLQWVCGFLIIRESTVDKSKAAALLLFFLGLMMLTLYIVIAPRFKRVAIGKNRIAVFSDGQITHYEWPEIKWIRPVPVVNVYKLKLRGKKERIYFLPDRKEHPVYGFAQDSERLTEELRKKAK